MPPAQKVFGPILNFLFNLYTAYLRRKFGAIGEGSSIHPILNTRNSKYIFIGRNVLIGSFSWVSTETMRAKNRPPLLMIGDDTHIGSGATIIAARRIEIGKKVIMAQRVTIVDHIHEYKNVDKAVVDQPVSSGKPIRISDDSFIGVNAVILPGVTIGKHAVIGANSVVSHDIPDFCVAAGVPARVIKRYDWKKKKWLKVIH